MQIKIEVHFQQDTPVTEFINTIEEFDVLMIDLATRNTISHINVSSPYVGIMEGDVDNMRKAIQVILNREKDSYVPDCRKKMSYGYTCK